MKKRLQYSNCERLLVDKLSASFRTADLYFSRTTGRKLKTKSKAESNESLQSEGNITLHSHPTFDLS